MAKRRPSGDGMVRKREDGRWEGRTEGAAYSSSQRSGYSPRGILLSSRRSTSRYSSMFRWSFASSSF